MEVNGADLFLKSVYFFKYLLADNMILMKEKATCTFMKSALCNNIKLNIYFKVHFKSYFNNFGCALKKHTYFD